MFRSIRPTTMPDAAAVSRRFDTDASFLALLLSLGLLLGLMAPSALAAAGEPALFRAAAPGPVTASPYDVDGALAESAVDLDRELLASNPDRITFTLPDGAVHEALRTQWLYTSPERFAWYGTLSPPGGGPVLPASDPRRALDGYVLLSWNEGRVLGMVRDARGTHYHLTPAADGGSRLLEVEPSSHGGCALDDAVPGSPAEGAPPSGGVAAPRSAPVTVGQSCATGNYTIDLLALYDRVYVGAGETAVRDQIHLGVDAANLIFANSDVGVTYDLVYVGPLTGEVSSVRYGDPIRFEDWFLDGVPEIERLRDDYGADMVSLAVPLTGSRCGAGVIPNVDGMSSTYPATHAADAYMVWRHDCGPADYTFAHEHAHNFGLHHDRNDDDEAPAAPIQPYAFGYEFTGGTGFSRGATVMGCDKYGTFGGVCSRIPYLSNPNKSPYGVPVGEPASAPNGGSFNACVANQEAYDVSMKRHRPSDAVPVVQIVSPAAGARLEAGLNFRLRASALDAEDGNLRNQVGWKSHLDGDLGTGYGILRNLTTVGSHLLTASVVDSEGKTGQNTIRVEVSPAEAPRVHVDRPQHLETVVGSHLFRGWATDASRVTAMSFSVDGAPVSLSGLDTATYRADVCSVHGDLGDPDCPNVGWQGTLDTSFLTDGEHVFAVTATDAHGQSKTVQRRFVTDNQVTSVFPVSADAYVSQVAPSSNYGSSWYLYARSDASGQALHSYLKFSVWGITGPVQAARLRVFTGAAWSSSRLYWMSSNAWNESTITWNNAPLGFHLQYPAGPLPAYQWVELDVTPIIGGDGTYTIGVVGADAPGQLLYSRDSPYPPTLEVDH